jgi:hypothetical protein
MDPVLKYYRHKVEKISIDCVYTDGKQYIRVKDKEPVYYIREYGLTGEVKAYYQLSCKYHHRQGPNEIRTGTSIEGPLKRYEQIQFWKQFFFVLKKELLPDVCLVIFSKLEDDWRVPELTCSQQARRGRSY